VWPNYYWQIWTHPYPEIDTIWRDEAQKRWRAYRAGELKTVSYEAVMQKYKFQALIDAC